MSRQNWLIFLSVLVAAASVITSAIGVSVSLNKSTEIFKNQNKPNVIAIEKDTVNGRTITIWNGGPGVAYDIFVEVHLADNIGNVGNPWVYESLDALIELETKTPETLYNYMMSGVYHNYTYNPPPILPPGIEFGYSTESFKSGSLDALFLIIRFKDVMSNAYYSVWDGCKWSFGTGAGNGILPKYLMVGDPVSQFYDHIT